jgi:hypothetical protein
MAVSNLAVLALLVLFSVVLYRAVVRFKARRRRVPLVAMGGARTGAWSAPAVSTPPPVVVEAVESVARAFPVYGLPLRREATIALENTLRRLAGVTAVYVSPVTAFAYIDYLSAEVTEEQLVQAIRRDGYQVGDEARRFDWRHVQPR